MRSFEDIAKDVRAARAALSGFEGERDERVRHAALEGLTLRRIAEQAGVSHQRVAQIINKEKS